MTTDASLIKRTLTWDEISELIDRLRGQLRTPYDLLLVITRGGMVPACLLSQRIGMKNIVVAAVEFYTGIGATMSTPRFLQFPSPDLLRNQRVLIVDDVWDSGRTAMAVRERAIASGAEVELAVLHFKPVNSLYPGEAPDHYVEQTNDWIVYPWEADE